MAQARREAPISLREWLEYAPIALGVRGLRLLPFRWRVPVAGWLASQVVAPVSGMRRRIRDNLDWVCPDLGAAERARLVREVPDNLGRAFIELFSPDDLFRLAGQTPFEGPGLAALEAARAAGRPVVAVSGHFGNYDVFRAGLILRGFDVGALYRPMNNRLFNARYEAAIRATGEPLFPRGRKGNADMVRHLKQGKLLALLIDQHMNRGAELRFFGRPALTAVSAAQLALRYDALLVPIYAIRQPDGRSFRVVVEDPVPRTDQETMTQVLNDSLEARVRANMGQWLWTHRRWKVRRGGMVGDQIMSAGGDGP
ncbi:lysophospholipid acyltransferase family protein [Rhodovulum euryhalinum]|uniref:KDO2-lipid IV(A) lauroyltransferase n=1 Tax=Rhodovulum euryhalinum TaxID=35805 RepID=A0A4R2KDH0_9RHOB|nr:lysophospholipid acyltransferase family protein [Rhodovulum euryhalinum]TCO71631.1 KDO2-lipid IV(A) lauroyltransferase [Rhodovulum euryhalinum]